MDKSDSIFTIFDNRQIKSNKSNKHKQSNFVSVTDRGLCFLES